jgi:glycine/D-amino acid oxidase-like deaminating enzyme
MNLSFDTIIVGTGIGGACVASVLCTSEKILVVDAGLSSTLNYSPASAIGTGICSPLMSRRARPVWRMETAVSALKDLLSRTGTSSLFSASGVLKPAQSADQAREFRDASEKWPDHGLWYEPDEARNKWPSILTPFGALLVRSGSAVSISALASRLRQYAEVNGGQYLPSTRMLGWNECPGGVSVRLQDVSGETREIGTSRLVLAIGSDYLRFHQLASLNLHPIKGQWIRISNSVFREELIPLSGTGYAADDGLGIVLGSTFEHRYRHLRPTALAATELIADAAKMVPGLAGASILEAGAALRVTVPGIRLPMVGPLTSGSHVWVFTGLGSKGILMAPMLASELPDYFKSPLSIPKEIRVTYRL